MINTLKKSIVKQLSKKTSETLEIIKIIADKINLLGLNAAIESAKAGDQGKGFIVKNLNIIIKH